MTQNDRHCQSFSPVMMNALSKKLVDGVSKNIPQTKRRDSIRFNLDQKNE